MSDNNLDNLSVNDFSQKLADKIPVPGGGGAAALVASLAAALASMVGNYSAGKSSDEVNSEIEELLKKSEKVRKELLQCINDDAKGFEPLSKAYKLDKDYPGRDETMERCLIDAAATPMKIAELSCEVIELSRKLAEKGSEIMISDAGCSAALAKASLYSAVLNIRVNTKLMKNRNYAEMMNKKSDSLMVEYSAIADTVYEYVSAKLF